MDIIFAGGTFRAKSKFANTAKNSSTRKIGVIGPTVVNCGCYDKSVPIKRHEMTQSLVVKHSMVVAVHLCIVIK